MGKRTVGGDDGAAEMGEVAASGSAHLFGQAEGARQRLLATLEEVQILDRVVALARGPGELDEITLTGGMIVEGGEELGVAAVVVGENVAQVNRAVDGFVQPMGSTSGCCVRLCVPPYGECWKKETSLVVVPRRSTRPNFSYILTPALP